MALEPHINGGWQPIAYFSKKLKPSKIWYNTGDRELLVYTFLSSTSEIVEGQLFCINLHRSQTLDFCSQDILWLGLAITGTSSRLHFPVHLGYPAWQKLRQCSRRYIVKSRSKCTSGSVNSSYWFWGIVKAQTEETDFIQLKSSPSSLVIKSLLLARPNTILSVTYLPECLDQLFQPAFARSHLMFFTHTSTQELEECNA